MHPEVVPLGDGLHPLQFGALQTLPVGLAGVQTSTAFVFSVIERLDGLEVDGPVGRRELRDTCA